VDPRPPKSFIIERAHLKGREQKPKPQQRRPRPAKKAVRDFAAELVADVFKLKSVS
jgi:hypothetical protein